MAKLNYDRDVKPLINKIQTQFEASRNANLKLRNIDEKWVLVQVYKGGEDTLYAGTLRECYCYVLGMAEFLM